MLPNNLFFQLENILSEKNSAEKLDKVKEIYTELNNGDFVAHNSLWELAS